MATAVSYTHLDVYKRQALRWSAAVVQQDASVPSALILTCRLLADAGRTEAAIEGLHLGVKRAIDTGNLPLAVAAVGDLKMLGVDVTSNLDEIAGAFCSGSQRLSDDATPPPPPLPHDESFQPDVYKRQVQGRARKYEGTCQSLRWDQTDKD